MLAMLQLKLRSTRGVSHQTAFMGNCYSHVFSLVNLVDEFSLKEMRTGVSPRFHLVAFVFGVNKKN